MLKNVSVVLRQWVNRWLTASIDNRKSDTSLLKLSCCSFNIAEAHTTLSVTDLPEGLSGAPSSVSNFTQSCSKPSNIWIFLANIKEIVVNSSMHVRYSRTSLTDSFRLNGSYLLRFCSDQDPSQLMMLACLSKILLRTRSWTTAR